MKRYLSTMIKYIEGETPKPNICKDCKHFKPDYSSFIVNKHYEFARCSKYSKFDIVDGKKYPEYASIVREYHCKGKWYEKSKI